MNPALRYAGRTLPLVLVWLLAAAPFAMFLLQARDPELAVGVMQAGSRWLNRLALGGGALGALLLLAWPPAPAAFRLWLERLRLSLGSDRRPLLRALGELQHLPTAARHHEVGRLALGRGELELALRHLAASIELDPTVAGAQHQFGLALFRFGAVEQASQAFANAERLDPGHAFGDALLHLGRTCQLRGDDQAARALLEQHAARHGGSHRSHLWLAEACDALGDHAAATAALRIAAAPPRQRLTAEENWYRATARVRLWRRRGAR